MKMQEIKEHFEKTIDEYEGYIRKVVPHYDTGLKAAASCLPFGEEERFSVLDLGCGTGNLSVQILKKYKGAELTLMDISPEMIKYSEQKIGEGPKYITVDFNECDIKEEYDAILSTLALHHLRTLDDKKRVFKNIAKAVKKGGIFVYGDVFEGETEKLKELYMDAWKKYMAKTIPQKEIEEHWVPNHIKTDRPETLNDILEALKEAGFKNTAVVLKYYGYGIVTAYK